MIDCINKAYLDSFLVNRGYKLKSNNDRYFYVKQINSARSCINDVEIQSILKEDNSLDVLNNLLQARESQAIQTDERNN